MDIVCYVFEGITALDIVGPYEVLARLPGRRRALRRRAGGPGPHRQPGARDRRRPSPAPTSTAADVLVMPGGFATRNLEHDAALLEWIRAIDATPRGRRRCARVRCCSPRPGLLAGKHATTHWSSLERLREYGAEPASERVVEQGKYVTAAGVSAGIDMALTLMNRIARRRGRAGDPALDRVRPAAAVRFGLGRQGAGGDRRARHRRDGAAATRGEWLRGSAL